MGLDGFFRTDRAIYRRAERIELSLVLFNPGAAPLFLFIPRGRAEGVGLELRKGPVAVRDRSGDPEPGLVGETRIGPGESQLHPFPLSDWLTLEGTGVVRVGCRITLTLHASSLREAGPGTTETAEVAGDVDFLVVP